MPAQKDFSISRQKRLSMPAMWFCVPGAQFSFEDQTNSFFLLLGQGVYTFEESPKSVQDVIGDVFCPGRYCSNREKCESIGSYVTTPRSIYNCGKCGAWLFSHKNPFMLHEHVKTTQTDKTRCFFAKKRWTWYPTSNYYLMSHFNQSNIKRKNCVWTTKYERLSEMCIVQHVETKNLFTFQPTKRLDSTTVKNAKLAATFWMFLLRTKTDNYVVWRWRYIFAREASRNYEKKTISIFKNFLRQSQTRTPELERKKVKMSPNME